MPRYEDDFGRDPRGTAAHRDVRDNRDRHAPRDRVEPRERTTRVVEHPREVRDSRADRDAMDTMVDPRIAATRGMGGDPRGANAGARLEPRPDRAGMDPRAREPELYRDPRTGKLLDARTGEVYQDVVSRSSFPRDDRMDTDDNVPTTRRTREVVDSSHRGDYYEDDHRGSKYNDYFVPGTGIDREVIQHEICRYLGNDATVRPYTNKDGRQGYLVRAYRALTSAMIDDLKRDSARWRQDQDRRSRQGRSTVSYAEMKGRQESEQTYGGGETMDLDDDHYGPPRHQMDPRDPRSRHAATPVSSSYVQDPVYPAYSLSSNQPGNYGPETLPRYGGNNTPPTISRSSQPGYGQPVYPTRTSAAPPASLPAYRDPRTGQLVSNYEPGYSEPGRRHR